MISIMSFIANTNTWGCWKVLPLIHQVTDYYPSAKGQWEAVKCALRIFVCDSSPLSPAIVFTFSNSFLPYFQPPSGYESTCLIPIHSFHSQVLTLCIDKHTTSLFSIIFPPSCMIFPSEYRSTDFFHIVFIFHRSIFSSGLGFGFEDRIHCCPNLSIVICLYSPKA